MTSRSLLRFLLCAFLGAAAFLSQASATEAAGVKLSLKEGPPAPAVLFEHFPSRLHAFVWRNWELIDTALLARTVSTSEANIERIAASMGLGPNRAPSREVQRQIYITIVRRNWHLLPIDQLLPLLGMSEAELDFRLKEDDALALKLGSAKPACPPLRYTPPSEDEQRRADAIRVLLEKHLGKSLRDRGEMPLAFAADFTHPPKQDAAAPNKGALRFIFSYLGAYGDPLAEPTAVDPYPDGLLAKLADAGVNGVWLHVVLRQLAPGGSDFPEFGEGREQRLESLRRLTAKAARHGIKIYLYINEPRAMPAAFFQNRADMAGVRGWSGFDMVSLCTSDARVRRWLGDSLEYVFKQVPGLGGVFTISASENPTNCASHGRQKECPRCRQRSQAEIVGELHAAIEQGVHRGNPNALVIAWDWGWARHGDATEHIRALPGRTWFMSVSEWAQPFARGGVNSKVGEYSLSVVGPGPRALRHWTVAKERGLKTVAKVQLNNTWELSTLPSLPVMELVAEHCVKLADAGIDGLMLSWSLGGYPSPNLRLAQSLIDRRYATADEALNALAVERYGAAAAPDARRAWAAFSAGFREFPYALGLYTAPQQHGPANLLYRCPTGYPATMTCYPFDDLKRWRGAYTTDAFIAQFEKTAEGWAKGLAPLRAAMEKTPADKRAEAARDLGIAEAAYCVFASVAEQARFVAARDALAKAPSDSTARAALLSALAREASLAARLYPMARADSRIGFEAANHYFFTPLDLAEKIFSCEHLRQSFSR